MHKRYNSLGVVQKIYEYTDADLLSRVVHGDDPQTDPKSQMTWDAAGNRISFTRSIGGTFVFVYDPTAGVPAIVEELIPPNNPVYYIREPDGALIARVAPETHYYHFDDLGSTLFRTHPDGWVSERYTYDAWGNRTSPMNTYQPYQYAGQLGYYTHYQDENMEGLLQLGVRFYEPSVGRYTTQDPGRHGLNWYAYTGNSPVSSIDPTGEVKFHIGGLHSDTSWENVKANLATVWEWTAVDPNDPLVAFGPAGEGFVAAGPVLDYVGMRVAAKVAPRLKPVAGRIGRLLANESGEMKIGQEACEVMERHHPYPKQFRRFFEREGINWRETAMMPQSAHRLKPHGLHTGPENVNALWKRFFKAYPEADAPMIQRQREWIDYLKSK